MCVVCNSLYALHIRGDRLLFFMYGECGRIARILSSLFWEYLIGYWNGNKKSKSNDYRHEVL